MKGATNVWDRRSQYILIRFSEFSRTRIAGSTTFWNWLMSIWKSEKMCMRRGFESLIIMVTQRPTQTRGSCRLKVRIEMWRIVLVVSIFRKMSKTKTSPQFRPDNIGRTKIRWVLCTLQIWFHKDTACRDHLLNNTWILEHNNTWSISPSLQWTLRLPTTTSTL